MNQNRWAWRWLWQRGWIVGLSLALVLGGDSLHSWVYGAEAMAPSQQIAAQTFTHPFRNQGIVYVAQQGRWREAFIRRVSGQTQQGRTLWLYTVEYLDGARELEGNIPVERMRTIEQAQREHLTGNVYDLSTQQGIDQMVSVHNQARRAVDVPDLQWSDQLADLATNWAQHLIATNRFEHRPADQRAQGTIGENLTSRSSSSPGGAYLTPVRAVEGWVVERDNYHYASNTCAAGQQCGHYTQMVWADTEEVGCGMARSADLRREVWVCNYYPAGNVVGQRPY